MLGTAALAAERVFDRERPLHDAVAEALSFAAESATDDRVDTADRV